MRERAALDWVQDRLADVELRLMGIHMPSVALPAVPAAHVDTRALVALETGATRAVEDMLRHVTRLQAALTRERAQTSIGAPRLNQILTILQLRVDALAQTLDFFMDAVSSRSDVDTGILLAGADRIVAAALARTVPGYVPPMAVTYLDSAARGGAIARARTRLPGGVILPIAMVRVSSETLPTRLTSVLHEAGHQLAVDLGLLDEARQLIQETAAPSLHDEGLGLQFASWSSELLADAVCLLLSGGGPGVDGLERVLSLPVGLLWRLDPEDPHPPGRIRVDVALEFARLVHPDPVLQTLGSRFDSLCGSAGLPRALTARIERLRAASAPVAQALARHRFSGLAGQTLSEIADRRLVDPRGIRRMLGSLRALPDRLDRSPPLTSLALLGFARLLGILSPAQHHSLSRRWLQGLAVRARTGAARSAEKVETMRLEAAFQYATN